MLRIGMEVNAMAGMIISGVIVFLVAAIMIGIGICQIRSKEPVGFYTGEKPPKKEQVTNVDFWNRKHGFMWIIYGICIVGAWICSVLIGDNLYALFPFAIGVFFPMILMIFYHQKLVKEYIYR